MSKLWTFGDSFTAGHGCRNFGYASGEYINTYKNYIDESKPIWSDIVANHFKYESINKGLNGATNDDILDFVFNEMYQFSKEDIVIIQISTAGRYTFPFSKKKNILGSISESDKSVYQTHYSPYKLKSIFSTNIESDFDNFKNSLMGGNFIEENTTTSKIKFDALKLFFTEFLSTSKYYERETWRFIKLSEFISNKLECQVYLLNEDIWSPYIKKPKNLIQSDDSDYRSLTSHISKYKQTIYFDSNMQIQDWHPSYTGHKSIGDFIIKHIENENTNIHNT